ncbi:MAG: hypothetical protein ABRQ39_01465 [Candidatus Eremiobacterota bacterium]
MLSCALNLIVLIAGLATLISGKLQISARNTMHGTGARLIGLVLFLAAGLCLTGIPSLCAGLFLAIAGGNITGDSMVMLATWIDLLVYGIAVVMILLILKFIPSKPKPDVAPQENNG